MKIKIIHTESHDWLEIWLDGICVYEGHSITPEELLRVLGIKFSSKEVPDV